MFLLAASVVSVSTLLPPSARQGTLPSTDLEPEPSISQLLREPIRHGNANGDGVTPLHAAAANLMSAHLAGQLPFQTELRSLKEQVQQISKELHEHAQREEPAQPTKPREANATPPGREDTWHDKSSAATVVLAGVDLQRVVATMSGMCLTNNITLKVLHMQQCDKRSPHQQWVHNSTLRSVRAAVDGRCLTDAGRQRRAFAAGCAPGDTDLLQKWEYVESTKKLRSATLQLCLEAVDGKSAGGPVLMTECIEDDVNQEWELQH